MTVTGVWTVSFGGEEIVPRKELILLPLVLIVFSVGCLAGWRTLGFEETYSYMEVSTEKPDHLIFRALLQSHSYAVVRDYSFVRGRGRDRNSYYLSLKIESGGKEPIRAIEYAPEWGGIRITIPRGFCDPSVNAVYYLDETGRHKIKCGSRDTWKAYLERRMGLKVEDRFL